MGLFRSKEEKRKQMKVFKLEVLIYDDDVNTKDDAVSLIEEANLGNHIYAYPITCKEADIGEWDDGNPLNYSNRAEDEMNRLFPKDLI